MSLLNLRIFTFFQLAIELKIGNQLHRFFLSRGKTYIPHVCILINFCVKTENPGVTWFYHLSSEVRLPQGFVFLDGELGEARKARDFVRIQIFPNTFQIVLQWERVTSEAGKPRETEEPRTAAQRFCKKFPFLWSVCLQVICTFKAASPS